MDALSSKVQERQTNVLDTQSALDNSAFANVPFEVREMIFTYALVSDEPVDESDPKITELLTPALGSVCQLFEDEGKELYFSKNEFLFKDLQEIRNFVESNSSFTPLVRKIKFDSNAHYGDIDLSGLSANCFWDNDHMESILRLENITEFTLSIRWHFSKKMFKLMERLFRHVKKVFERHGVYLERLSIVARPERKRRAFFIAKSAAESVGVHGSRINGRLRKADIPIILGHQGEIYKPGDEIYDIYTRHNTYIRDPAANPVDNKSIEALNMGVGLD